MRIANQINNSMLMMSQNSIKSQTKPIQLNKNRITEKSCQGIHFPRRIGTKQFTAKWTANLREYDAAERNVKKDQSHELWV